VCVRGWGIDQRSPVPSFVWQSYTEGVYTEQNHLVVMTRTVVFIY
jgi:hypothetical protein